MIDKRVRINKAFSDAGRRRAEHVEIALLEAEKYAQEVRDNFRERGGFGGRERPTLKHFIQTLEAQQESGERRDT